jgi:hypothetical protein
MKILSSLFIVVAVLFSVTAQAQDTSTQKTYAEYEAMHLNILLAKDGTGIIKGITCPYCDFNFVKITPKTQALANGKTVDMSRARSRFGKPAFIQFNAKTAEVQTIIWDE